MHAAADFRLYHGNSLEVLAALLAETLAEPAPGAALLEPDTILIPQASMRRWLQRVLAERHGVAANLRFLAPGEFVGELLAAAGEDAATIDAAQLVWRLYATLADADALGHPAFARLGAYLAGTDAPRKAYELAAGLADTFAKYQAWRRDWLVGWDRGAAPDDWQAELWRRATQGRAHRAAAIDAYLRRHSADGAPVPAGLPPRVFAFGCINVSPDVLAMLVAAARGTTMHFYLPTPTRRYWGDLRTLRERIAAGDGDPFADEDNPLLAAWGRAGREFVATLFGDESAVGREIEAYADPDPPHGLLQRIQLDLIERRAPGGGKLALAEIGNDRSLEVHACATRLREVEVLHDRLRALLEDDAGLEPRDIAVMAPDIDRYAPLIASVFGGAQGTPRFIPYTVADGSALIAYPLAELALRLIELPRLRITSNEVLDLAALPPVMHRFALDEESLAALRVWIAAAGARWGLDAAHRARLGAPAENACTWSFALRRLLLGHATGADAEIAGVAPWPELEGHALDALDALIRLLDLIERAVAEFDRPCDAATWQSRIAGLLDALVGGGRADAVEQRALGRILAELDAFRVAAAEAGLDAAIPREVVHAHLAARLGEGDARQPFLAGGVTFCRMVPMRLIPFRAIALLGLDDGEYPRRDPSGSVNRLAAALHGSKMRRLGDRSVRDDDRFLFLQLLAAADRVLHLSYIGFSAADGSPREPSVLVSELLDVAARYFDDPESARAALVVRHPLQPFGRVETDDARQATFDPAWRGAFESPAGSTPQPPFAPARLPSEGGAGIVSLDALRRFLIDPPRAFLRDRLALRVREDDAHLADAEPFAGGDAIERSALNRRVLDALCGDDPPDDAELCRRLQAEALLAPGAAGGERLRPLLVTAHAVAAAMRTARRGALRPLRVELELDRGVLAGVLADVDDAHAIRAKAGVATGRDLVRWQLDALVLAALGDSRSVLAFADFGDGAIAQREIARRDRAAAARALEWLIERLREGFDAPLPFRAAAGWAWYEAVGKGKDGEDAARAVWINRYGKGEGNDASTRIALRGALPFDDAAATRRFGALAVEIFDALCEARVPEAMR